MTIMHAVSEFSNVKPFRFCEAMSSVKYVELANFIERSLFIVDWNIEEYTKR